MGFSWKIAVQLQWNPLYCSFVYFYSRVVNFNTLIKFKWIAMTVISDDSLQIHFDIQKIQWEP